jgi:plasmid stabilization system protein ParE
MLRVVFTQAARAEVGEAVAWYEDRHLTMAELFTGSLDQVVNRIAENPSQFPVIHKGLRRALLRRFPYGVFFRVLSDQVQVIAVLHTSRDPRQWGRPSG